MTQHIPHPEIEQLLPPFLAHLPVAFSSPHAPPSLLPLLAPILRSRICLLANNKGNSSDISETWLTLLTWSRNGDALTRIFASQDFEPHPSGEIEIGDHHFKGIRRVDQDTLQASIVLQERGVEIIYVWVPEDEEGSGWKIIDVKVLEEENYLEQTELGIHSSYSHDRGGEWYSSILAADQAFSEQTDSAKLTRAPVCKTASYSPQKGFAGEGDNHADDDNDDTYWAMYDGSPARSSAVSYTMMSQPTEDEYFSRYAAVSPALEPPGIQDSSYPIGNNGQNSVPFARLHSIQGSMAIPISPPTSSPRNKSISNPSTPPHIGNSFHSTPSKIPDSAVPETVSINSATSPIPSPTIAVAKLENQASAAFQAEVAIKRHICTQLKSLYRLAKGVGIDQVEFKRIVSTEMEILSMVDEDDEGSERY